MNSIIESPLRTLLAGLALTALLLVYWLAATPVDTAGLISVLLRFVHVAGAMVWVGLAIFFNFIQLRAVERADAPGRLAILRWIGPGVAKAVNHSSNLVLLSGVLMLIATGYLFGKWTFSTEVYLPPAKSALLWAGAGGGIAMWAAVHFGVRPMLKVMFADPPVDDATRAAAHAHVKLYARLVLFLALPVTFAMVVAAHLG